MPTNIIRESAEAFDKEFSNVGWLPENKERVKSFLRSQQLKLIQAAVDCVPGERFGSFNECRSAVLKQLNEMRETI